MTHLIPITNIDILMGALREEDIYKDIIGVDDLKDWAPNIIGTKWFIIADDKDYVGIAILHEETNNLVGYHGGIYKPYRSKSFTYLKDCIRLVKEFTGCKLITTQPSKNRAANILVRKCGMKKLAVVKNGYKDDDLVIFVERD